MITFGTDVLELWWRVNLLHRDAITEGHLKVWPNIRLNAGSKKKVRRSEGGFSPCHSALKLVKSAILKVQKHIFSYFKNGKK